MNIIQIRNNQTFKMRRQDTSAAFSRTDLSTNFQPKKDSLINQFIDWFRDFLDNAE